MKRSRKQLGKKDSCVICQSEKDKGIYLLSSFICTDCEREIVSMEPEESQYQKIVHQLKRLNIEKISS